MEKGKSVVIVLPDGFTNVHAESVARLVNTYVVPVVTEANLDGLEDPGIRVEVVDLELLGENTDKVVCQFELPKTRV